MANITCPADTNFDLITGSSASATVDVLTFTGNGQLLIDTDTRYCSSHVGAATGNNGSLDNITVDANLGNDVLLKGTTTKMIPYKSGSGTPPALFLALATSAASYSGGIVTVTTAAHGLTTGTMYRIGVGGIVGATLRQGYNGIFNAICASSTTLKYPVAADPGTATITRGFMGRYFRCYQSLGSALTLTAATRTGSAIPWVATFTKTAHGYSVGDLVVVAGVTPAGYNGTFNVMAVTTDTFDVWLGADPGGSGSAFGTATKQVTSEFQSAWSSFTALPNPTGTNGAATLAANGWIKVRNVIGGSFARGTLTIEGGTTPAATAITPEFEGWIEVAGAETGNVTVPRLSTFTVQGDWFYPRLVSKTSTSITRVGTLATLTLTAHGVTTGSIVTITGAVPSQYNGTFTVANAAANTFDYTMASDPGGSASTQGDFSTQICTSGVASQTIQLPAAITNTYYAGIWIETGVGTDSYEFYPTTGLAAGTGNASVGTEAARGKVVWQTGVQGLIRIGNDGTNANGYLPVSGCKIRIPNVVCVNTLKAVTQGANSNAVPNTTVASRYDFTTTGGGVISIDKMMCGWYPIFQQAYSVNISHSCMQDLMLISEIAQPMTWSDMGVGCTDATRTNIALAMSLCFAGGTFTDCKFSRNTVGNAASNTLTDCFGFTFTNTFWQAWPLRTNANATTVTLLRVNNCTFTNTTYIGGGVTISTSTNITMTTNTYCNVAGGTTPATVTCSAFVISLNSNTIKIDGVTFGGITNVQPSIAFFSVLSGSQNIKIRNIGSAATPLSAGSANTIAELMLSAAGSGVNNVEFKRIYMSAFSTGLTATVDNSLNTITFENVWGDAADNFTFAVLNGLAKGITGAAVTTGNTSQYGHHFQDYFTSSTVGKIAIVCNEKTTVEPSASSYTFDSQGPEAGFDSVGSLHLPNLTDQLTWTFPYYMIGHTAFTIAAPTLVGTVTTNLRLQYDIAQGPSGSFTGSFKNLYYPRITGGGTSGQFTITMADTTGVAVNDYVFGTNVGTNAKVTQINNGTTVTVDVANAGTVSGTLTFNQLPFETITSAQNGFKLKVRATVVIAGSTSKITNIAIPTVSTSGAQAYQYPLDLATITLSNVVVDSRYELYDITTATTLATGTAASATVAISATASVADLIRVRVRKASGDPKYVPFETNANIGADLSASVYVSQITDTIAV